MGFDASMFCQSKRQELPCVYRRGLRPRHLSSKPVHLSSKPVLGVSLATVNHWNRRIIDALRGPGRQKRLG